MRGRHNICAHLRFMSSGIEPGYFREYVNIPVPNFLPIPADMSLEQAALVEPHVDCAALHGVRAGEARRDALSCSARVPSAC